MTLDLDSSYAASTTEESSSDDGSFILRIVDLDRKREEKRLMVRRSEEHRTIEYLEKGLRALYQTKQPTIKTSDLIQIYGNGSFLEDRSVSLSKFVIVHYRVVDSASEDASKNSPISIIQLNDIGCVRKKWWLPVNDSWELSHIEELLRRRFRHRGPPIHQADSIKILVDGKRIKDQQAKLSKVSIVHYQVSEPPRPVRPKFWHQAGPKDFRDLTNDLFPLIEAGATASELRRQIARKLDVADPNRILLLSRRDLRGGSIAGNHWVVQKTFGWQPLCYIIRVVPPERYILLRGLNREFLFHPQHMVAGEMDRNDEADVKDLQTWLEKSVFKRVDKQLCNVVDLTWTDVQLTTRNRIMGSFEVVRWGATVNFQIPDAVARIFVSEEAWLLPEPKECSVCMEVSQLFHRKIAAKCQHDSSLCKACVDQWIVSGLESGTSWEHLSCPECAEVLRYDDISEIASKEVFEKYVPAFQPRMLR